MGAESSGGFPGKNVVWVIATIEEEKGRWVVYLEVGFWEPNELDNIQTVRHRIQSYPKKRLAEIVAQWMERGANKDLSPSLMGV